MPGPCDLCGGPELAADGVGQVFVNLEEENLVATFDSQQLTMLNKWLLNPCRNPTAITIDRKSRRLFIGCRSHGAAIVNADTGKVVQTLPIGDHVDAAAFDSDAGLAFVSNSDGTINVFRQDSADHYTLPTPFRMLLGRRPRRSIRSPSALPFHHGIGAI